MALIEVAAAAEPAGGVHRWVYRSVETVSGDPIGALPLREVVFSRVLNGVGAFSAQLAVPAVDRWADVVAEQGQMLVEDGMLVVDGNRAARAEAAAVAFRDAIDPLRRCIVVERDGIVQDAYLVVACQPDLDAGVWQIAGVQLWALLRSRRIRWTTRYSQVDQFQIVRSLVERAQQSTGGDLGIVVDPGSSGRLRDREYAAWDDKPLGEAIEQLSEVIDGFDFRLDTIRVGDGYERRLRLFYPRAGRDAASTGHVWTWGSNAVAMEWPVNGERTANAIAALGAGEEAAMLRTVVTDTSVLAEGYPLLEGSLSLKDVSVRSTLEGHARAELANRARPISLPTATVLTDAAPTLGSYVPGDYARLVIPPHRSPLYPAGLDRFARIVEIEVRVPDDGDPGTARLTFDEVP